MRELELKGKDVNSSWGSSFETVTIQCTGIVPSLVYDSGEFGGSSGTKIIVRKPRLKIEVTTFPFKVDPSSTEMDARKYFELQKVLSKKFVQIVSIDSDFARIVQTTDGLIDEGFIDSLPFVMLVEDAGEISSNYANGNFNCNFILTGIERYGF